MNIPLLAAAALIVLIGALHSILGERRLIGPMLAPQTRTGLLAASAYARAIVRFAWHLTTLSWWAIAVVVGLCAADPQSAWARELAVIFASLFAAIGLVCFSTTRGRHIAWPFCLAVTLLLLWPVALPA
jgi:hypothetical protein